MHAVDTGRSIIPGLAVSVRANYIANRELKLLVQVATYTHKAIYKGQV